MILHFSGSSFEHGESMTMYSCLIFPPLFSALKESWTAATEGSLATVESSNVEVSSVAMASSSMRRGQIRRLQMILSMIIPSQTKFNCRTVTEIRGQELGEMTISQSLQVILLRSFSLRHHQMGKNHTRVLGLGLGMMMVVDLAMMTVGLHMVMMILVSVGKGLKVFSGLSLAVSAVRKRVLAMTLSRCRQHTSKGCDSRPGGQTRREKLHA